MSVANEDIYPYDFDHVLQEERAYLGLQAGMKPPTDSPGDTPASPVVDDTPWALCLSGGGIRSATFGLGVLQGLARLKLLSRFHYLSTVSGGGYIGSWLSRWIGESGGNIAVVEAALQGNPEPPQVRNLRAYSNYLSPVWGLSTDFFTLVSIFLRNLLLNWFVILPLLVGLVIVPRIYLGLALQGAPADWANGLLVLSGVLVALGIGYVVADLPSGTVPAKPPRDRFPLLCFTPIVLAAMLLGLITKWDQSALADWDWWSYAIAGAVVHGAGCMLGSVARLMQGTGFVPVGAGRSETWGRIGGLLDAVLVTASGAIGGLVLYTLVRILPAKVLWFRDPDVHVIVTVPGLLLCFWLATTVYVALARAYSSENDREWWARSGAWWLRAGLGWLIGFGLVIHLPRWLLNLPWFSTESLIAGGGLWGLVIGLIGYWSKNGAKLVDRAQGFAAATGTRLLDLAALAFIVILLVVMCLAADRAIERIQPCAACAAIAERAWKTTSAADVEMTARGTEAAARSVEAVARNSKAPRDAGTAVVSEDREPATGVDLRRGSGAVTESARTLSETAAIMRGSAAETMKAAETAARASEMLSRSAQAAQAADSHAGHALTGALQHATSATVVLASAAQRRMREADEGAGAAYALRLQERNLPASILLFLALTAIGLLASFGVGVNTFSLHGLYGNRLVRAYLGSARDSSLRNPHWFTGFDFNDNLAMHRLRIDARNTTPKLLHVVNVALNLVGSPQGRLEWQQRKAASFTVSPLHSGGADIGYRPSATYSGDRGISLGRAMAISGAAASSNMGYHSSSAVAFAMTFFNIRLGWWLPNPSPRGAFVWRRSEPRWSLLPLLWEALGMTSAGKPYVYLSDGGHFENLGLYEMVRRGCNRIVVVDASADPRREYGDLQEAMRKIRVDLGVSIEFPDGVFDAPRRCIVGRIRYAGREGHLYYLKPVLCGDEPLDVLHYARESGARNAANAFPHQSTADQFFNESQFESYRMLGLHTVGTVLGTDDILPTWPKYGDPGAPCGKTPNARDDQCCHCPKCSSARPSSEFTGAIGGNALSGLSGAVQSMGQGALLATAITVGGVLGVSGTVALQESTVSLKPPPELRISKTSIDELAEVTKLGVTVPEVANIAKPLDELRGVLAELTKVLSTQSPQSIAIERLTESVHVLDKRLLSIRPGPDEVAEFRKLAGEIGALSTGITRLQLELAKMNQGAAPLGAHLVAIQGTLHAIEKAMRRVPPPSNVRGIE